MAQALDQAVAGAGGGHQAGQRAGVQPRQQSLEQALLVAPHSRFAQRHRQGLAAVHGVAGALEGADVLGQRPVHQHRSLALGLQAVKHAQRARRLAGEHSAAELEHVVAGHVQHSLLNLLEAQLAGRVQQGQLLQLLVRGQQIALHTVGKEGQRLLAGLAGLHALALCLQALGDPLRQLVALHRVDPHGDAGAVQRTKPGALLLLAVQPRQVDDGQQALALALRKWLAILLQRHRAFFAGLARRDADLDQLLVAEQAHGLRRTQHAAPVEMRATDGEHLAVAVAVGTGRRTQLVGCLLRQQRLVTVDGVNGFEPTAREVLGDLVRANLHGGVSGRSARQISAENGGPRPPGAAATARRCRCASRAPAWLLPLPCPGLRLRSSSGHASVRARHLRSAACRRAR